MINIPIWLFVIMCICTAIVFILLLLIVVDIISEMVYQKHELEKYRNAK